MLHIDETHLRDLIHRRRARSWGFRVCVCAVLCARPLAALESPPVSLADDIRWKKFQPASEVYIDTTLQFTPAAAAAPAVDPTKDKLALWLAVDTSRGRTVTNLCVYSSRVDLAAAPAARNNGLRLGGVHTATPSATPQVFKLRGTETLRPGRWYRLTVRTIRDVTRRAARTATPSRALLGFQIYLDGALLSSDVPSFSSPYLSYATTRTHGWLDPVRDADLLAFLRSGAVFASLCGESADAAVASVGFRGDGLIDDVAVSPHAPAFLGLTSLDFTLALPPSESPLRAAIGGW